MVSFILYNLRKQLTSSPAAPRQHHRQRGAGMLELLISLLILGVGAIGSVKLFNELSKDSKTSYFRSKAQFLMDDFINKIHFNGEAAIAGCYLKSDRDATPDSACPNSFAASNPQAAGIADDDIEEWAAYLTSVIPNSEYTLVSENPPNNNVLTLQLFWTERVLNAAGDEGVENDRFTVTTLICSDHLDSPLPSCDAAI